VPEEMENIEGKVATYFLTTTRNSLGGLQKTTKRHQNKGLLGKKSNSEPPK
jgi:predicted transcriptional regulator YdeE